METPPARGRDAAMLQRQLDDAAGQRMHRRRVSRSLQQEDSFFTPQAYPQGFSSSPKYAAPASGHSPHSELASWSPRADNLKSPGMRAATLPHSGGMRYQRNMGAPNSPPDSRSGMGRMSPSMVPMPLKESLRSPSQRYLYQQPQPQPLHDSQERQQHPHKQHQNTQNTHSPQRSYFQSTGSPKKSDTNKHTVLSPGINSKQTLQSPGTSARALSSRRMCEKCNGDISGHFVRALNATFHIDCFTCADCQSPCAAKFFPVDNNPLCEHCYFKRQNLLCYRCGSSLRGSYITALDRKYHVEHFSCSLCTTVFGPEDSYFEYSGDVYCRCHYSALFAFGCESCKSPILKQFVETYRGGKQQQWHPECYMIFKFWNVKVADSAAEEISALRKEIAANSDVNKPLDPRAEKVIAHEDLIDSRTMQTWTYLCGFEEACAAEIGNLVQTAVNGQFREAYKTCARLVAHVKVLFVALDPLSNTEPNTSDPNEQQHGKEAKTLCRKIVSYMSLLSKTRTFSQRERIHGLAKDLLTLASAMAHYLKVLIRQGLSGAFKADKLDSFLAAISAYDGAKPPKSVSPFSTDRCLSCNKAVEDRCYRQLGRNDRLWHARPQCFKCTVSGTPLDPSMAAVDEKGSLLAVTVGKGLQPAEFIKISKLEQYAILLHVALARLDLVLSNTKRPNSQKDASVADEQHSQRQQRLEMDQNSSSMSNVSGKKAAVELQQSNDSSAQPKAELRPSANPPTALERASLLLNEKAGLTLDDIRRIVAAEQTKSSGVPDNTPQEVHDRTTESLTYFGTLTDDEYSWVRYIGQAMLQPFTQKYLKKDFEAFSINTPGKQATLWGRVGKVFTGRESEGRVFGQPLDRLVSKHGVDSNLIAVDSTTSRGTQYTLRIPSFVDDCLTAMRQKDMSVEGIFRKNGNIRRQREFVEQVDRNPDENALLADESPIQLAALLKKFLRDLPEPLMCSKLSVLWSLAGKLEKCEQIQLIQILSCALPRSNRNLLEVLVNFLKWVSSFAHVDDETGSKMDISNLATVLGPTLALSTEDAAAASNTSIESAFTAMNNSNKSLNPPGGLGSPALPSSPLPSASVNLIQGSSQSSYKSIGEPLKLMIDDCCLISRVPADVDKCLRSVKGPPRKLSYQEVQELLRA